MNASLKRQPAWLQVQRLATGGRNPLILAWTLALSLTISPSVQAGGVALEGVEYSALPGSRAWRDGCGNGFKTAQSCCRLRNWKIGRG